jgi:hypothetical protein
MCGSYQRLGKLKDPEQMPLQTLRKHKCQPRLLYPAKFSITIDGETKVFQDQIKFTQGLSRNPALQMIIKEKLEHKDKNYALEKERNLFINKTKQKKKRQPQNRTPNLTTKNNRKQ